MRVGQFTTEDNLKLYYNCWPAQSTAAPCVVYLHGLESHVGWFFNLAEYLNSNGINVYAFDRRGSGLNKNSSKNFCSKCLLDDLKIFLNLVKGEHPNSRVFLIGLCLGGTIAVSFVSRHPDYADGIILMSPSIKSKLKFSFTDILSILFRPNAMLKIPIEDTMFTSNEKHLIHLKKDAMRLRYIPAQHLLEIAKIGRDMKDARRTMRLPVLLMLAGTDEIIDTESARRWYQRLPSSDKTLRIYSDFHHILTFEENAGEVMADISGWILARSNA